MKFVYRFLLFFAVSLSCLCGGLIVGVKYHEHILAVNISPIQSAYAESFEPEAEEVASGDVKVVTPLLVKEDTVYILEEYDITNETTQRTHIEMPSDYVGKGIDEVGALVEGYNQNPTRKDELNNFVSQNLVYFSADKIIVRKFYNLPNILDEVAEELPTVGFYATVIGDEVVSYEADKRTVYSRPGILATDLPAETRVQLEGWMYFETLELLEEYLRGLGSLLESLTS